MPDLWKTFKDRALKTCDEMRGRKKTRRDRGNMWWWNEKVKDTIAKKKAISIKQCRFPSEKYNTQYKRIRNQTKKVVAKAVR